MLTEKERATRKQAIADHRAVFENTTSNYVRDTLISKVHALEFEIFVDNVEQIKENRRNWLTMFGFGMDLVS